MTARRNLDLVRRYKALAEKALPGRVSRVVLYGSRARGQAGPESDWDVAVFLDGPIGADERRILSEIAFDLLLEEGSVIQTVVLPRSMAPDATGFLARINSEGLAA
jgi:predicted nucleotidyltransferase